MTKNNKGYFLRKRLVFWLAFCVVACLFFALVDFTYSECATTYTNTTDLSDYHRTNIAFMQNNGDSSMNTIIFKYDIENGKYIIGFALLYNLACLLAIVLVAFGFLNAYYYLMRIVNLNYTKRILRAVKHTSVTYKFHKDMLNQRGCC